MSISSALTALNQDIQNARTAIVNKGGTITIGGGSSQLATDIATIPSGSGGDITFTRISDDNGNTIGTHYMNFVDGNNNKFKVILLDKQYRANGVYLSTAEAITNLPIYNSLATSNLFEASETATTNCDLILAHCTLKNRTSSGVEWCRSKSFIINGITYYGQLWNMKELITAFQYKTVLNSMDTSSGTELTSETYWTSTQCSASTAWYLDKYGWIYNGYNTLTKVVCPILEIPNGE